MHKPLLSILAVLVFAFSYPRLLVSWLGEANPWTSYLYMYGLGFVVFFIGLVTIRKSKACLPGRGRDGFWYKVLIGGFVMFATLHGTWVALALYMPHYGGVQ